MKPGEWSDIKLIEFVRDKLLAQNRKALDVTGSCVYRAPDGAKCAVGHLIPDDMYNRNMEGNSFRICQSMEPVVNYLGAFDEGRYDLVRKLQDIHDRMQVEEWAEAFEELRAVYQ